MARRVGIDGLADALADILEEYGDDIAEKNEQIVQKVGRQGAKALRQEAGAKFNGKKYAKGWGVTFEGDSIHKAAIIHNKKLPGLPHLLEHGHAKRGGGRVNGRIHIKPIEDEINKLFEKELEEAIE